MRTRNRAVLILLHCFLGEAIARAERPPDFQCGGNAREEPAVTVNLLREAEGEIQVSWRFNTRESLWGYAFPNLPEIARYRSWLESVKDTPKQELDESWEGYALEQRIEEFVRTRRLGILRPMNCLESALLATQISRTGAESLREFVGYVLRSEVPSETKIYFLSGPNVNPPRDNLIKPMIRQDLESGWWLYAIIHNHTGPHPAAAPSASDAQYGMFWVEDGAQRFIVVNGIEAFDVSGAELKQFLHAAKRDGT